VNAKIPQRNASTSAELDELADVHEGTPELIPSGSMDADSTSSREEDAPMYAPTATRAPAKIFSLGYDDVVVELDYTPVTDGILSELPLYEPKEQDVPAIPSVHFADSNPSILPVSKYVSGKLISLSSGPPRKRSRYEYAEEDDEPSAPRIKRQPSESSLFLSPTRRSPRLELEPEKTDVALFNPENKHVRDRLHASHAFRPPSEFGMPTTQFYESRASSHWLWNEDQELRRLVKEYSYNWSLISAALSQPSTYASGPERRTPWECFERWVQLEGLPAEMSKTQYFRTYQSRLEAAHRTVTAAQLAAQQQLSQLQAPPSAALQALARRRTTQPIRVERRKSMRYIHIIDGMKKLAKKRENTAHKQQESIKAAQLRKAHEGQQSRPNIHTPAEFSQLKYEKEQKTIERQQQMRDQMLAQQRTAQMQRTGQMPGQASGQPQRNPVAAAAVAAAASASGANHASSPLAAGSSGNGNTQAGNAGQNRAHSSQMGMQNNLQNGNIHAGQMGMQGMPQAQMQMNGQGQQRYPQQANQQDLRMLMQQRQITQAQAMQLQAQQQLQSGNLANAHLMGMPNPAMLGAMNSSPNGMPNMRGGSGSPMPASQQQSQMGHQPQTLSNGHQPLLMQYQEYYLRQKPGAPLEEAKNWATSKVKKDMMDRNRQQQSALDAAAGVGSSNGMNSMTGMNGMNGLSSGMGHMSQGMGQMGQMGSNPYQQQQAMNGASGSNMGSLSPTQNYNSQLRGHLLQQQSHLKASPSMHNAMPASRSATPQQNMGQHQRTGSGTSMMVGNSPTPPTGQMAHQ